MDKGCLLYDLEVGTVLRHIPQFLDRNVPADGMIISKYQSRVSSICESFIQKQFVTPLSKRPG